MSGADLIRFDDGSTQTVPSSSLPQFAPKPQPVAAPAIDAPPQYAIPSQQQPNGPVERQTRNMMTPYGLPLQDVQRLAEQKVYQPGRAAYDPNAVVAKQVPVPVSRQTQVQGAKPYDESEYWTPQANEANAQRIKGEADVLAANTDLQIQRSAQMEMQSLQQQQAAKLKADEDNYNERMASLNEEAAAVARKEINPDRVFQNMGTGQKLMFALAGAFSGYATQGQRNPAAEYISHMIDVDVRAQEHAISRQQGNVDNALSRLSQQWGSIEAGRSALKVQQAEVMKQKLATMVAESGTKRAVANAKIAQASLDAIQQRELLTLRDAARGSVTTAETAQMQVPIAGQAGGYRMPTDAEVEKRIAREQGLRAKGQDIIGGGLKNEATAAELRGEIPSDRQMKADEQISQRQEHLGKSMSEVANLRTNVDQIISRAGITEDEKGNAHHKGIPGVGMGYNVVSKIPVFGNELASLAANAAGADSAVVRNQAMEALTYKIKDASGAAFSEAEAQRHAQALGQGMLAGEDTFAQAVVNFRKALDEKEQSLRAGAGLPASRGYDAAKGQLQREAAYSKSGIRGKYQGTVSK